MVVWKSSRVCRFCIFGGDFDGVEPAKARHAAGCGKALDTFGLGDWPSNCLWGPANGVFIPRPMSPPIKNVVRLNRFQIVWAIQAGLYAGGVIGVGILWWRVFRLHKKSN